MLSAAMSGAADSTDEQGSAENETPLEPPQGGFPWQLDKGVKLSQIAERGQLACRNARSGSQTPDGGVKLSQVKADCRTRAVGVP